MNSSETQQKSFTTEPCNSSQNHGSSIIAEWFAPLTFVISIFIVAVDIVVSIAQEQHDNKTLSLIVLISVGIAAIICLVIAIFSHRSKNLFIVIAFILLLFGELMYKYIQRLPSDIDNSATDETTSTVVLPSLVDSKSPSAADLDEVGDNIVYPGPGDYLPSYETKYVKSKKGHSIYVFWDSSGDLSHLRSIYAYEKDEVTVIAKRNSYSCIIFTTLTGEKASGWVNSDYLVSVYS